LKGKGLSMARANTSNQVINIIPPRKFWDNLQSIRTLTLPNQRCGPHISFVDPFVVESKLDSAAELLRPALKTLQPFMVKLSKFGYFTFRESAMLYLEPEIEPKDGLQKLLDTISCIFPQCTDQIKGGKFTAHVSVARFNNEAQLLAAKPLIERNFQTLLFKVKEIYILSRIEGDPFEVRHVIPLGEDRSSPCFGERSPESSTHDESQLGRTVFVGGLTQNTTEDDLKKMMRVAGFTVIDAEILLNPNDKLRTCGIVEFKTRKEANNCVANFRGKLSEYVQPMYKMVFPGVIRDCCSVKGVKKYIHNYPWINK